jgi:hypothetical protein
MPTITPPIGNSQVAMEFLCKVFTSDISTHEVEHIRFNYDIFTGRFCIWDHDQELGHMFVETDAKEIEASTKGAMNATYLYQFLNANGGKERAKIPKHF